MIRLTDISLPFDHSPKALAAAVLRALDIDQKQLADFTVVRRSIDARRKNHIVAVYTIDVKAENESDLLAKFDGSNRVRPAPSVVYRMPVAKNIPPLSPVVVGTGPCGLFAGLILAQLGFKPLVIERGKDVDARIKDVNNFWRDGKLNADSNVQFGEGGAGTFSDGKLTTQIKDKANRCRKVLNEFVKAGAPEDILYNAKPHIGTDNLIRVVKNIRKEIIRLGGAVRFETKMTGIEIKDGKVIAAVVNDSQTIETGNIILALGHSARDTFQELHASEVPMQAKPFSIGVRIEHPQALIDKAQYGKFAGHASLGTAEYKLVAHCSNGRSAYTFCMCPGGRVIASSSEPGMLVTNGMSVYKRDRTNANSALLVGVTPDDFDGESPLAGVEFQRKWERKAFALGGGNYFAPVQLVGDFLAGVASSSIGEVKPSYEPGTISCDIAECLPDFVTETIRLAIPELDKKLRGFARDDAVITAVESRSSSPVRILRDETFQSIGVKGLYPAGEGAGYAGGIISAAIDGIKTAEAVIAECP